MFICFYHTHFFNRTSTLSRSEPYIKSFSAQRNEFEVFVVAFSTKVKTCWVCSNYTLHTGAYFQINRRHISGAPHATGQNAIANHPRTPPSGTTRVLMDDPTSMWNKTFDLSVSLILDYGYIHIYLLFIDMSPDISTARMCAPVVRKAISVIASYENRITWCGKILLFFFFV